MALTDKLIAIGDRIRSHTNTSETILLAEMPEHIDVVYENGYDEGYEAGEGFGEYHGYELGYNAGFEDGMSMAGSIEYENGYIEGHYNGRLEEYDKWWDSIQDYGNRTNYADGFNVSTQNYYMFHKEVFYPKYDIICVGSAARLFYAWEKADRYSINLAERLEECSVYLDTSGATDLTSAFNYSHVQRIPVIDVTGVTEYAKTSGLFANSWGDVHTIDGIILNENTLPNAWFSNATGLRNLTIVGKLAQNGFNVKSCTKLSKDSLLSILESLSTNITETKTITFSTAHQTTIETDADCKPYWEAAKAVGWSFVYA